MWDLPLFVLLVWAAIAARHHNTWSHSLFFRFVAIALGVLVVLRLVAFTGPAGASVHSATGSILSFTKAKTLLYLLAIAAIATAYLEGHEDTDEAKDTA